MLKFILKLCLILVFNYLHSMQSNRRNDINYLRSKDILQKYNEAILLKKESKYKECTKIFKELATQNYGPAQYQLAHGYFKKALYYVNFIKKEKETDPTKSLQQNLEFIQGKNYYDQNILHKAMRHLKEASILGHQKSTQLLIKIYFEKAEYYYNKAIRNKNLEAQNEINMVLNCKNEIDLTINNNTHHSYTS